MNFDNKGRGGGSDRPRPSFGSFRGPDSRGGPRRDGRSAPDFSNGGGSRSFRPQGIGGSSDSDDSSFGGGSFQRRSRDSGGFGDRPSGGFGDRPPRPRGEGDFRRSPSSDFGGPRRRMGGGGDRRPQGSFSRRRDFDPNEIKPFWIYGIHASLAAIANSKRQILEMFVSDESLISKFEDALKDANKKISVNFISEDELERKLPKGVVHQKVGIRANPIEFGDTSDLLAKVKDKQNSLLVMLDGITDPHNMGAIIRSAVAFGADGVIIPKHNSCRETPALLKSASGAYESMEVACATNLNTAIAEFKEHGFWCYGLDASGQKSISEVSFGNKVILVIGSEGDGMRELVTKNCDEVVKIEIVGVVESLNASVAAGIAMYAISCKK